MRSCCLDHNNQFDRPDDAVPQSVPKARYAQIALDKRGVICGEANTVFLVSR